jgi:hypothetical protein
MSNLDSSSSLQNALVATTPNKRDQGEPIMSVDINPPAGDKKKVKRKNILLRATSVPRVLRTSTGVDRDEEKKKTESRSPILQRTISLAHSARARLTPRSMKRTNSAQSNSGESDFDDNDNDLLDVLSQPVDRTLTSSPDKPAMTPRLHTVSSPISTPRRRNSIVTGGGNQPLKRDLYICLLVDPLAIDETVIVYYIKAKKATEMDRQWFYLAQPTNYKNNRPIQGKFDTNVSNDRVQMVRRRAFSLLNNLPMSFSFDDGAGECALPAPFDSGKFADCRRDSNFVADRDRSQYEIIYVVPPVTLS